PMEHGIVCNWEDVKHLWDYTFDATLKVNPCGHKVLFMELLMNPKANRQWMVQVMFYCYIQVFLSILSHLIQLTTVMSYPI
ncbi:hypothetical protein EDD16DRAFT_1476496, partial [Pisolithus croceorrhizus]